MNPRLWSTSYLRSLPIVTEHYETALGIVTFEHQDRPGPELTGYRGFWSELRTRWRLAVAVFRGECDALHWD